MVYLATLIQHPTPMCTKQGWSSAAIQQAGTPQWLGEQNRICVDANTEAGEYISTLMK